MAAENCLAFPPLTSSPSIETVKGHLCKRKKKKVNFRGGYRLHVKRWLDKQINKHMHMHRSRYRYHLQPISKENSNFFFSILFSYITFPRKLPFCFVLFFFSMLHFYKCFPLTNNSFQFNWILFPSCWECWVIVPTTGTNSCILPVDTESMQGSKCGQQCPWITLYVYASLFLKIRSSYCSLGLFWVSLFLHL